MIVYNGGTYDLIHAGHLRTLRKCRELAGPHGQVVIGLNSDAFVAEFKGHPVVQPYEERSEILAAIRYVDRVVPNVGGRDSRPTLTAVSPDVIAVGADWWSPGDARYCTQMGFDLEWLVAHHIRLVYLDAVPGHSSTRIRETAASL